MARSWRVNLTQPGYVQGKYFALPQWKSFFRIKFNFWGKARSSHLKCYQRKTSEILKALFLKKTYHPSLQCYYASVDPQPIQVFPAEVISVIFLSSITRVVFSRCYNTSFPIASKQKAQLMLRINYYWLQKISGSLHGILCHPQFLQVLVAISMVWAYDDHEHNLNL